MMGPRRRTSKWILAFARMTAVFALVLAPMSGAWGALASFNGVEPGAAPFGGKIYTKVAGADFTVDIVALDALNLLFTLFTGNVAVEVVDASAGGACASLPTIATFPDQNFGPLDLGRRTVTVPNAVAEAYPNARIRMKYPAASPSTVSCSGDNFAIRPASLSVAVTHADRTSEGAGPTLNNTALANGAVHNAGRPFRMVATAVNGLGAVTANYSGSPAAALTTCADTACTATTGTLTPGTWTASSGVLTTTTASYDDVGAFNLQLQDTTFTAVDAADGTPASLLTIASAITPVGRFVPDRFVISGGSITPRSDIAGCSASSFTYMRERMNAGFTITAVRYPSGTTPRYSGALARLNVTSVGSFGFGAIDGTTVLGSRIDTSLGASGTWTNGAASVSAIVAIQRNATPDGPYNSVKLGINPVDPDGVGLDPATLNLDADADGSNDRMQIGGTTGVRFGRLRLQNAVGSQLTAVPVPIEAQYWNGAAFVTNTADNCTTVAAGNVVLGNYQKNLGAGETSVTIGGAFTNGVGTLRLSAPGATNNGAVDVAINLTTGTAGASCTAGMPASTASSKTYLQGAWCGAGYARDPTARVTFGLLRSPDRIVFRRENF